MKACHRCGRNWEQEQPPGYNNTCEGCGMPLHSCANCEAYRPSGAKRCIDPGGMDIRDGHASNSCEAFQFRMTDGLGEREASAEAGERMREFLKPEAKDAENLPTWDQLFG